MSLYIVVLCGPGRVVDPELTEWLLGRDYGVHVGSPTRAGIPEARNKIVEGFLAGPWDELLMLDNDMSPVEMEPLVNSLADVAWAWCKTRAGALAHPHGLTCAALKLKREALARLTHPFFAWQQPSGCECSYFNCKVLNAKLSRERTGTMNHIPQEGF